MADGRDGIMKQRQIALHIPAQWIVAEWNTIFYHWLYNIGKVF